MKYDLTQSWPMEEDESWWVAATWAAGVAVQVAATGAAVLLVVVALYAVFLRHANRSSARPCSTPERLEGKTVVVTANDEGGVGVAVALDLAGRGRDGGPGLPPPEEGAAAGSCWTERHHNSTTPFEN
ncbi:uncharacterized protein LOC135110312 isoform X2 [Scylla paramamosain]|uniref:uncharacterized protein LOC135110312 isoform X2 n=1 Tax=Scylla paramamosain TaxID=85552 RepID=UPI0030836196